MMAKFFILLFKNHTGSSVRFYPNYHLHKQQVENTHSLTVILPIPVLNLPLKLDYKSSNKKVK